MLVLHSEQSSCLHQMLRFSLSATQLTSITLTAWGSRYLSHHEEHISVSFFIKALVRVGYASKPHTQV